ncbi:MAG: delta-class carbonic anhydrase [Hyphomicrobiaceae bacterium]
MKGFLSRTIGVAFGLAAVSTTATALCVTHGPQAPRDISSNSGANTKLFSFAPPSSKLNLCNIHFHTNAEHKGPDFNVRAGGGHHGGFKCNAAGALTQTELAQPTGTVCRGLKVGATIEVHWVYTSCDVKPGKGLGSCFSDECTDPKLRVEAQVFLAVNDSEALDFMRFAYDGHVVNGLHQAKSLPTDTGKPVIFHGSTTGPAFTHAECSPFEVTWSVRPRCARLDISSLGQWCSGNVFKEDHAHGVRELIDSPELLAEIE